MRTGRGPQGAERARSEAARAEAVRLLVVEDEVKVACFVAQGMQEEGYEVDVALSAAEARVRLGLDTPLPGGGYHLLILDWMLPDGDGLELARQSRSQGLQVPLIMLTARDAISERVAALDAGADDYLVKPFAFAELVARVRALLRRSQATAPVLRVGDLEIDLVRHCVRRGSITVPLTTKELAVLAYLARHAGRAVSRAELLGQIWSQSEGVVTTNLVDAQIARLRDKLAGAGAQAVIHTVRRIGYALGKPPGE
ncbi:MAG: response regulator transcription factor [Myxococcales bacterium]|nr:response regulator transcription factor [Myxococcota bacterium]MDW8284281.1 response regulator transcription factor [Myxococcales bacterium]